MHLFSGEAQHSLMDPDPGELATGAPRLSDLVLMVRKDEVESASVDLEAGTEVLLGHRRALDVPAAPPAAPRGLPPGVLARLVGLPEGEVPGILLERVRLLLLHLVDLLTREGAVGGKARHPEVHISLRRIGEIALDQLLDQRDDLADRFRRLRFVVWSTQSKIVGVLVIPARRALGQLGAGPGRRLVDLVVDVGDVDEKLRFIAPLAEPALEPQREDGDRVGVADVDPLVHRRAAVVDPHRPGRWGQLVEPTSERVVELDRHGGALPPWRARPVSPLAPGLCRGPSGPAAARANLPRPPSARG